MPKLFSILAFFVLLQYSASSQQDYNFPPPGAKKTISTPKAKIYASIGWHRVSYSNSTIHFKDRETGSYDFKLIKAKAIDDNDLDIGKGIDAPQWSLRIGYYRNDAKGWGLELSYDHAKYILKQGQRVRIQGRIHGEEMDKDTTIHRDFLEYEHTDGANYYMLSLLKNHTLWQSRNKKHELGLLLKAGAGPVIPRTDSKVMGNHYNEHYHIAGFVVGTEVSLRYEVIRNFYAELSLKGTYANYLDVLLYGKGRASQHWWSLLYLFTVAYQLPVGK